MPLGEIGIFGVLFPQLYESLFSERRSGNDYRLANADKALKVADVLALAVLADGVVTDAEWAALERLGDPDAVVEWKRRAVELGDPIALASTVRGLASGLTKRERRRVMALVEELVEAGAGLPDGRGGYRQVTPADGPALRSLFRNALDV